MMHRESDKYFIDNREIERKKRDGESVYGGVCVCLCVCIQDQDQESWM